jgi:WD40 repeat protein
MQTEIIKLGEFVGHSGSVYALEKGLEENLFFSGSSDRFVTQWNVNTFESAAFTAKLPGIIYCIKYIPNYNLLLCGTSEGIIHVINTKEKKEIKALKNHSAPLFAINYSKKNNLIFSSGGDGKISIINPDLLSVQQILTVSNSKVRSLEINFLETELIVACGNEEVKIFSLPDLKLLKSFNANKLATNTAVYQHGSNTILSGGRDAILNIYTTDNYTVDKSIAAHNFAIYDIKFLDDLNLFATASRDKTFKLWNSLQHEFIVRVNAENYLGHTHSVNRLLWLKENQILLSAGDDRKIIAWKVNVFPK